MGYLITGAIVCLVGIGLIMNEVKMPGIIVLLIGAAIGIKGRKKIDKSNGLG